MDLKRYLLTALIPNGGNITAAGVDLIGDLVGPPLNQASALVGIVMPSGWTTANLTFQGSADNATYNDIYDENGSEVVIVAAASRFITIPPRFLIAPRYLKVRSGTTGTPVAQGAERSLALIVRPAL